MATADLLNPVIAFITYLGMGGLVYLAGRALAPAVRDTGWKLQPYACGEIAPLTKMRPNYNFYHIAFLFTILHVGALMACTSFGLISYSLPLLYVSLVFFGMSILVAR
jgi:NADH:ubiquinone oxidoreductase subunit 3 (subunit A)